MPFRKMSTLGIGKSVSHKRAGIPERTDLPNPGKAAQGIECGPTRTTSVLHKQTKLLLRTALTSILYVN